MAVPNTARKFPFLVFLVCAAAIAAGAWYVLHGGTWEGEQEGADDEEEPALVRPDGGAPRRRSKKNAPGLKKKPSDGRLARGGPARQGASPAPTGPSGMSYEAAIAGNNLNLAPGTRDVPDLTDAELAGPIREGTFLDACGVPSSTHVTVKVAIRNGRAVGVSVEMAPASREMGWCVERHVRGQQWPSNAKMDSFVTSY
ncbi:MAG TPA: hypothetical protein VK550_08300 [Polyangiaceae bacterium]|nr:hypothetical protein [Polyangiaceae bacterium]